MYAGKVACWGNSLALRIPHGLADILALDAGTKVDLSVDQGALVVRPQKPTYSFSELMDDTPDELEIEVVDTGEPVGNEAL